MKARLLSLLLVITIAAPGALRAQDPFDELAGGAPADPLAALAARVGELERRLKALGAGAPGDPIRTVPDDGAWRLRVARALYAATLEDFAAFRRTAPASRALLIRAITHRGDRVDVELSLRGEIRGKPEIASVGGMVLLDAKGEPSSVPRASGLMGIQSFYRGEEIPPGEWIEVGSLQPTPP